MLRHFLKTKVLCGLLCFAACCHQAQAKEDLSHSQSIVNTVQTATDKSHKVSDAEKKSSVEESYKKFSEKIGKFFTMFLGSIFLCAAGSKILENLNEEEPLSLFPDVPDKIPAPAKVEKKVAVPISGMQAIVEPQKSASTQEERNILASQLRAFRTMEDIKRKRAELKKAIALARKENDEQKIDEITAMRKELTKRQRLARLQAGGPELAEIREQRRLLTKKMTIARRRKDTETMDLITSERWALKAVEKDVKASVKAFNYRRERKRFLKPADMAVLKAQEYQRAA